MKKFLSLRLIILLCTLFLVSCSNKLTLSEANSLSATTDTTNSGEKIGVLRTLVVDTVSEIHAAFKDAQPGDLIKISAGTYTGSSSGSGYSNAYFALQASGTAANPIYVESETSTLATLQGSSNESKYVFYVKGDYVRLSNLKITEGKQGLMTDQSSNSIYTNLEVWNIGQEGIHIRDGSSNVVIDACNVHDTGVVTADYGEGIYVGSDYTKWTEYPDGSFNKACDNVVIKNSKIGPNCAAEAIDIKEGTSGTIVEYNILDASGITGANSADSFIDIKGNNAIIRYNTAYRNGAANLSDAFQTNERSSGWGFNNDIHHNTVYMDLASGYVVNVKAGLALVSANTRNPTGLMYSGAYTEY